jgi:hypothetical protein
MHSIHKVARTVFHQTAHFDNDAGFGTLQRKGDNRSWPSYLST